MTITLFAIKQGKQEYCDVKYSLESIPEIDKIQYHRCGRIFSACAITSKMDEIRTKIENLGLHIYTEQEID